MNFRMPAAFDPTVLTLLQYNYGAHTAFWDRALGTRWTDHKAAVALYDQNRKAAQRRFDSKVNGRGQIESSKGVSLG